MGKLAILENIKNAYKRIEFKNNCQIWNFVVESIGVLLP